MEHASKLAGAAEVVPSPDVINPTRKRPARAATNAQTSENKAHKPVRLPLRAVQDRVIAKADDLALANDSRETSAVIAKQEGLSEAVVDRILDLDRIRYKQGYKAAISSLINGLSISRAAVRKAGQEIGI